MNAVWKAVGVGIFGLVAALGLSSSDESKPPNPSTPKPKKKTPSSAKRAIAKRRVEAIKAFAQSEEITIPAKQLDRLVGKARKQLLKQRVKAKCELYDEEANPLSTRLDALYDLEQLLKEKLDQLPVAIRRRNDTNV